MSEFTICPSCGVPWVDHLGMTGTCAKLQKALETLRFLQLWIELEHECGNGVTASVVERVSDEISRVLEELQ